MSWEAGSWSPLGLKVQGAAAKCFLGPRRREFLSVGNWSRPVGRRGLKSWRFVDRIAGLRFPNREGAAICSTFIAPLGVRERKEGGCFR